PQGPIDPVALLLPRPPPDPTRIRWRLFPGPVPVDEGPGNIRKVASELLRLLLQIKVQPSCGFDRSRRERQEGCMPTTMNLSMAILNARRTERALGMQVECR